MGARQTIEDCFIPLKHHFCTTSHTSNFTLINQQVGGIILLQNIDTQLRLHVVITQKTTV